MLSLVWVLIAQPPAPQLFCQNYPTAPICLGGQPSCSFCHTAPPNRNLYGAALEGNVDKDHFEETLPAALVAAQEVDSDNDGVANLIEIQQGSSPSDIADFPQGLSCVGKDNPQYKVCEFDALYAYRKLRLDFCGASPTDLDAFASLDAAARLVRLDSALDECLRSAFWRGKDGQLWQIAHKKIRPVGSLKDGPEDTGDIPLGDYYDDYALFTWSQIDDHDARDVLLADFFVTRDGVNYAKTDTRAGQFVATDKRVGNITTAWMLAYFTMFTPLPRNIASQTYRAYLGLDIAKQEGIYPIAGEPKDIDGKGVTNEVCAQCHATLDPLTYPFVNYNGLSGLGQYQKRYIPQRATLLGLPNSEAGFILGKPVNSLREWAEVAANSDQFVVNIVRDYWTAFVGLDSNDEFVTLWRNLKQHYRVEKMLHELVHTEAYGVP